MSPIAIVGMGCRFAGAPDVPSFWRLLREGRDSFGPVPADRWSEAMFRAASARDMDRTTAPRGAFLHDIQTFPALALGIPPRRVEVMDPQQRFTIETALEALEDAGYRPSDMPRRTGVYVGLTAHEYRVLSGGRIAAMYMASGHFGRAPDDPAALADAVERLAPPRPFSAPGVLGNMSAAAIAQELDLHGPAYTTDAACASALVAVADAVAQLRAGQVDAALAGGAYLQITPEHYVAFSRIGAMSDQGRCLPFDARADGFVQGDGVGMVLLKRLDDARRDGDRVYAVIHGVAVNNDGRGDGPMAPVKDGQIEVIRAAWADAGIDPARASAIEAHGTGTDVGDVTEVQGLRDVFGAAPRVVLGSTKASVGHTMSAAGIAGLIRAALSVHHRELPPVAGFEQARPELGLDDGPLVVPTAPVAWSDPERLIGVSSFGFGGTNGHAVLGAAHARAPGPAPQAELVLLSGPDEAALRALCGRTADAVRHDPSITVAGTARAWAGRRRQPWRAAVVAADRDELITALDALATGAEAPAGARIGLAGAAPRLAWLYPGQGAQRLGMLRDLRRRFPEVEQCLREIDAALDGVLAAPVTELIDPPPTADRAAAAARLTATEHCQPAMLAAGLALSRVLDAVGLRPTVVTGHSLGEFAAASVAGVLSAADAARFVARRGLAMAALPGDHGAMAAVMAGRDEVAPHLPEGVVIANENHPRQVVIAGGTAGVEAARARLTAAGLQCKPLDVSHGFHSPVLGALDSEPFLAGIALSDPTVPVASGIADAPYADAADARAVFARHAIRPVRFVGALRQCEALGADVYLQVGAGGPLASFARGTRPEGARAVLTLASLEDDDGGRSLLDTLGTLWVIGADVDVRTITAPAPLPSLPPTALPREPYWVIKDTVTRALKLPGASERPAPAALAAAAPAAVPAPPEAAPPEAADAVEETVLRVVSKVSAYPRAALRTSARLTEDLGFDSLMVGDLSTGLAEAFPGLGGIPQDLLINSPTVGDLVDFVRHGPRASAEVDDDAPLRTWRPVWADTPRPPLPDRDVRPGPWRVIGPNAARNEVVEAALRAAGQATDAAADVTAATVWVAAPPADPVEDVAAFLEAIRGLPAGDLLALLPAALPVSEGIAGALRALAREWPDAVLKAVRTDDLAAAAADLPAERAGADRTVDVRLVGGVRQTPRLDELPDAAGPAVTPSDVVVVTGGTRGIGLRLGLRLAADAGRVVLLGRGAPAADDAAAIAAFPHVEVRQADVSQPLGDLLADLRPTLLVHAAGTLADGPIAEVDPAVGRAALAVKARGWTHAVAACGPTLRAGVALGSWAGRFGNRHQAWYGAANALLAGLVEAAPFRAAIAETGPWTGSAMASSIPAPVQAAMRADGVDFVGDQAGLAAVTADLLGFAGACVHGRRLPARPARLEQVRALSVEAEPWLRDHAIDGTPVFALAAAADLIAETAALPYPLEVSDLTLYQGVTVKSPVHLTTTVDGARAALRSGRALAYTATVRPAEAADAPPIDAAEGPAGLTPAEWYRDAAFHGPLLQGLVRVDAMGEGHVRGAVRASRPADWIPGTRRAAWSVDPLALDAAMQLAASVAWVRWRRAGTPVGVRRLVVNAPLTPGQTYAAEATFGPAEADRFTADRIVLRDDAGRVVLLAEGVVAELRKADGATFVPTREQVDPAAWKEVQDLELRLEGVEAMGLRNPYFSVHEGTARDTTVVGGRTLINFSSYNYVGLSGDPEVLAQVHAAVDRYGTSVSASRVASGERPFHHELEAALAAAQGAEDALLFTAGHATNVTTIGHLFGPEDLVLHDEYIHDSALQGIKLSGAARRGFRHDDPAHLDKQLTELRPHYRRCLIVVEGVYSMDGDICDLPSYVRLKRKHGALLMVDEAHSFAIIGATGRGVAAHWGVPGGEIDIWMGTLSKSLASCGGWIAGSKALIRFLRYTAPGFVYSAGLTPANGMAALASLRKMLAEPWRVHKLQSNAAFFHARLKERDIDTGPARGGSGVVPVVTGNSLHALVLSDRLLQQGINVQPIVYPAVADDAARLRFFLSSTHSEAQLAETATRVADTLAAIREEMPILV